jgi:hypothetical protein
VGVDEISLSYFPSKFDLVSLEATPNQVQILFIGLQCDPFDRRTMSLEFYPEANSVERPAEHLDITGLPDWISSIDSLIFDCVTCETDVVNEWKLSLFVFGTVTQN